MGQFVIKFLIKTPVSL